MSPATIGGRQLGVERNGGFTEANTDPIPGGRLWPEAALTWCAMRAAFIADGGHPDDFRPGGPASSARSIYQQQYFWRTQPPPAASPGTSNHGWGIAVDCPFPRAQAWLLRNCGRFGWSHDEGARVGEAWHFRYVGASPAVLRKLQRDPFAGFTPHERRWIAEYDRLVRSGADPSRRRVLRLVMTLQRKRVWKAAQPASHGGDGKRWTRMRKRRYASLKARTT
jgi:hypothetical protein